MSRTPTLIFVIIVSVSFLGLPVTCNKRSFEIQEGVYNYKTLLDSPPDIRVLLVSNTRSAELAINGFFQIAGSLNNIIDHGYKLQKSHITVSRDGISVGDRHYRSSEIRISTAQDGQIELNNTRYRGDLRIFRQSPETFSVVEELDLECFIAGVLGSEMPQSWNREALRAQAVTARTYAMYKLKERRDEPYHLTGIELAYRGMANETRKLNSIVNETRGVVMVYKWKIFPAYFHSTCGGHTEDITHVFGKDYTIPPLSGVACNYCSDSKYFNWKKEISKSEIEEKLQRAKVSVPNIRAIKITDVGCGGHGSKVEIDYDGGVKEINANDFRLMVGPNNLFSTAFYSETKGNTIVFSGNGWGHGVGLCQYGAQNMAGKGFSWIAILKHYYPGIDLVRVY